MTIILAILISIVIRFLTDISSMLIAGIGGFCCKGRYTPIIFGISAALIGEILLDISRASFEFGQTLMISIPVGVMHAYLGYAIRVKYWKK